MNAAAAALLLAITTVNAVPQVGKQRVLASFESDKARARHQQHSSSRRCPIDPWLPFAVRRRRPLAGGERPRDGWY